MKLLCCFLLLTTTAHAADTPEWIWAKGDRTTSHTVALRTTFQTTSDHTQANVWLANAYCDCEVLLDGKTTRKIRSHRQPTQFIIDDVRTGKHQLSLICQAVDGPSAVAARLQVAKTTIVSNASWQGTSQIRDLTKATWTRVNTFGSSDQRVWSTAGVPTNEADDYTQWKRALKQTGSTSADDLWVQPGYQVERLYSASEGEGSWVSLAEDPQGRWVIGHEDPGLLRVTLKKNKPAHAEKLEVPPSECRGLVFAHDSLYAMGNKTRTLFRLRDTNNDDQFDKNEQLKTFEGGTGHGRNQLTLGPNGKIYAIFGDSVRQPEDAKYLPPRIPSPGDIQKTQNGFVARTDAEGKQWEVVVRGLRNPYGLDFNQHGDLFTYDADAEYDMGSSWYRPTRVLHLLSGGDYGWRSVTKRWPPYNPDSETIPQPTLDIGRGSPTAVEFGTNSKFPPPYRDALYVLDWSYGRILAVHWQPNGSSYVGATEVFLRGSPLNVTDVEFGRDGAMYFVTGGRKTQSGLYRVKYTGKQSSQPKLSPQQTAVAKHAAAARRQLRQLESLRGQQTTDALETAWKHLDAADPWIRHAARNIIETQPVETWRERALGDNKIDRFFAAALALQRFGNATDRAEIGKRLSSFESRRLLPWQQTQWVDLSLRQLAANDPGDTKWDRVFGQAKLIFPANQFSVDQPISTLLAKRDTGFLVPRVMNLLAQSSARGNQREQMHWLYVLSTQSRGWTPKLRGLYFIGLREMNTFEAGEGMPTFRRLIRDAAIAKVHEKDREHWKKWLSSTAVASLPKLPPARTKVVKQWSMKDFLDLELGKGRDLERGKQMFAVARCVVCHRAGTTGGLSGPDLTNVASRFATRDLLASILEPSAVISEKYASTSLELEDGRVVSGRALVTDFRSSDVQIVPNLLTPEKTITVSKQGIVRRRVSPVSPMPQGLMDGLSKEEVLDLLAFLRAG